MTSSLCFLLSALSFRTESISSKWFLYLARALDSCPTSLVSEERKPLLTGKLFFVSPFVSASRTSIACAIRLNAPSCTHQIAKTIRRITPKVKIIEFNVESLSSFRSLATFLITKNNAKSGLTVEATGTDVSDKPRASKFLESMFSKPFFKISSLM